MILCSIKIESNNKSEAEPMRQRLTKKSFQLGFIFSMTGDEDGGVVDENGEGVRINSER